MGWDYVSELLPLTDISFIPQKIYEYGGRWNDTDRRKPKNSEKNLSQRQFFSTTNPTGIDPGANPGIRGEWPATNHMSHGTAPMMKL
jgi:hypothetical protein